MSVGQWDSDYIGGGGGKVSETTNKERLQGYSDYRVVEGQGSSD